MQAKNAISLARLRYARVVSISHDVVGQKAIWFLAVAGQTKRLRLWPDRFHFLREDKEKDMAKKEPAEYKAMISDEGGVIRGRIPSPLVRDLGAKPGDYLVFDHDGKGNVSVKLAKGKAAKMP